MKKEYLVEPVTYYRVTLNGKTEIYEQFVELENGCIKMFKNGRWTLINPSGRIICNTETLEIYESKEGMTRIFNGEKYTYYNEEVSDAWPFAFDQAWDFEDGIAKVIFNGTVRYVSKKGRFADE